jgi:hypothetical protein
MEPLKTADFHIVCPGNLFPMFAHLNVQVQQAASARGNPCRARTLLWPWGETEGAIWGHSDFSTCDASHHFFELRACNEGVQDVDFPT